MGTSRLFQGVLALFALVTATMLLWGQNPSPPHNRIPLAEDWSSRHVIYSSTTNAQRDYQIKQQYRYWNQWFRRNARVQMQASDKSSVQFLQPQDQKDAALAFFGGPNRDNGDRGASNPAEAGSSTLTAIAKMARSVVRRPWTIYGVRVLFASLFLLALALSVKETRRRRIAIGFVLGLVAAFIGLQMGCAGNTVSTPQPQVAQSLQRDWQTSLTAGGLVGEEMFPAKFTFDINAAPSCTNDFVVFTTGLSAGATVVDIIAYNQLYTGAGGICVGGPSVLWAYQTTSNGGNTVTSPVLSRGGTQVAFMEGTGGTGVLHILRPGTGAQGTLASPVTVTPSATAAAYITCKATPSNACLFNIPFDSLSSPFVDYGADVIYVGDNGGNLHKFTGVFNGSPAEAGAPWPIAVHSGEFLLGPVKDDTSGNIFVTDAGNAGTGNLSYVREAGSTVGTCGAGSPPCLGSTTVTLSTNPAPPPPPPNLVSDSPIVDSATQRVFAFTGHQSAFGSNTTPPARGANVFQTDTALTSNPSSPFSVGQGDRTNLHTGAFDSAYFSSVANGHLYVCGNSGANLGSGSGAPGDNQPTLKRVSFDASGNITGVDAGTFTLTPLSPPPTGFTTCSPVTEINNGGTDRMFMSVQALGPGGCGGNGCIMSVIIPTASPFTFPSAIQALLPEPGGTSGIVIDNVSSAGQASSLYFTILANSTGGLTCSGVANVGCAVKATQAGLN
jgi:hypothetical protein